MVDPYKSRLRDYMTKNALQIVTSLLLTVLIAVFAYHFRRVEALEARVWNLEQGKSSVDVLGERTLYLQKQIDELCSRVEKSNAMITELLKLNGLSASVLEYREPEKGG